MTVDTRTHTLKSKHLAAAIGLNAVIFLVEIVGGALTNSFALISDALHNFSDLLALALSYTASRIVLWKANSQKSYGYGRVEILVAFTNAAALAIIGLYVIYEAAWRFADPRVINGTWMLGIASLAFAADLTGTSTFQPACNTCPEQRVVVDYHHTSRENNTPDANSGKAVRERKPGHG